jgi:hypothetical protein
MKIFQIVEFLNEYKGVFRYKRTNINYLKKIQGFVLEKKKNRRDSALVSNSLK